MLEQGLCREFFFWLFWILIVYVWDVPFYLALKNWLLYFIFYFFLFLDYSYTLVKLVQISPKTVFYSRFY